MRRGGLPKAGPGACRVGPWDSRILKGGGGSSIRGQGSSLRPSPHHRTPAPSSLCPIARPPARPHGPSLARPPARRITRAAEYPRTRMPMRLCLSFKVLHEMHICRTHAVAGNSKFFTRCTSAGFTLLPVIQSSSQDAYMQDFYICR